MNRSDSLNIKLEYYNIKILNFFEIENDMSINDFVSNPCFTFFWYKLLFTVRVHAYKNYVLTITGTYNI